MAVTASEIELVVPQAVPVQVHLLAGMAVVGPCGLLDLPLGAQRLLAFLCLQDRPVMRNYVAGVLWPDKNENRASANLRSGLWRLHQPGVTLVRASATHLCLDPTVKVDVNQAVDEARALINGTAGNDLTSTDLLDGGELLPDWYEDWVLIERERFRQLRLHALEALCLNLVDRGRFAMAIDAGLAAVAAEPLRESAHRALIIAHLAEGNPAEAIRQLVAFRAVLEDALGICPSAELVRLVHGDAAVTPRHIAS